MPPKIKLLSDRLVSQIAAGEVVERPASVVKELLENALDADATALSIELHSGGKRRIRVVDDGVGMDRDDALLAFDRHATSKIASLDDLQRVATLGFRGEALSSIAAVSRVELLTAQEAGEGWRVRIEGGRVSVAEPAARPRGTTVEVAALFFNVPARRKFLKSPQSELRRVVEVVQGYALARPGVRFELLHEGRSLLEAPPASSDLTGARQRIGELFGRGAAGDLVELPRGGSRAERIEGFVGRPASAGGRRQFVFINGRLLRDRAVLATFYRTVREVWRSEQFPPLFLFLELPPEELDVNVHPQKAEVRFRDPSVLDRVRAVLRRGLLEARGEEMAPLRELGDRLPPPLAWEGLGARDFPTSQPNRGEVREPMAEARWAAVPPKIAEPVFQTREAMPLPAPLSGRRSGERSLRLLGQYKGAVILLEAPDGLLLMDQHAAHERILYERLRRCVAADRPEVQQLLSPHLLELGPAERMRLEELAPRLEELGFHLAPLSGKELALLGLPPVLSLEQAIRLLSALAAAGGPMPEGTEELGERVLDALAASSACREAIKIHRPLSEREMEALVSELFSCSQPYACPHGRPTILQMTDTDLERRFGRRG